MKCHKCGFEYSGNGPCPSCGTNAIVVSEDYLRRKREYEEKGTISIGNVEFKKSDSTDEIMEGEDFEEEDVLVTAYRKMKNKAAGAFQNANKAKSGKSGKKLKKGITDFFSKITSVFKSKEIDEEDKEKKRGKKKVQVDKRIIIAVTFALAIIITGIVLLINVLNSPKEHVYMLTMDEKGLSIYVDGKETHITSDAVSEYACAQDLSMIIYKSGENLYAYAEGESHRLELDATTIVEQKVSEYGSYAAVVTYDEEQYVLYRYSPENGLEKVSGGTTAKNVLYIDDEGKLVYSSVEYSPINGVNSTELKAYIENKNVILSENYKDAVVLSGDNRVIVLEGDNRLTSVELNVDLTKKDIVEGVTAIYSQSEKDIYTKSGSRVVAKDYPQSIIVKSDNTYYYIEGAKGTPIFTQSSSFAEIIYNKAEDVCYYALENKLYDRNSELKATMLSFDSYCYNSDRNEFVYVDSDEKLFSVKGKKTKELSTGISNLKITGDGKHYTYTKDGKTYIAEFGKKKGTRIGDNPYKAVVKSGKRTYALDEEGKVSIMNKKGKIESEYENCVEIWIKVLDR